MDTGVTGCIVDEHIVILVHYSSVAEDYVRHITNTLIVVRSNEVPARLRDNLRRIFQTCSEGIQYITQTRSRIPHTVSDMNPAFVGLDWSWALTVLHFVHCVISALIDNIFLIDYRIQNVIT
ncbi:hypothetical protein D3C72_1843920 [compost metagenome]